MAKNSTQSTGTKSDILLLTDADIERESNGRVTNNGDLNLKVINDDDGNNVSLQTFKIGGLYDPRVFGSMNRCVCSKTSITNVICPQCGCRVLSENDYIKSYAYYKLNYPYIYGIKVNGFIAKLRELVSIPIRNLKDLWSISLSINPVSGPISKDSVATDGKLYVVKNGKTYEVIFGWLPDSEDTSGENYDIQYYGLMGLQLLSEYKTLAGVSLSWMNSFINNDLVISSPGLRPFNRVRVGGEVQVTLHKDSINYRALIHYNEMLPELINHDYTQLVDRLTLIYMMNVMINRVMSDNDLLAPSKESFVRNIVDTRVSKSIRANIIAAMDLRVDQMYVPKTLAYKALEYEIINRLLVNLKHEPESNCIKLYKNSSPEAMNAFEEIVSESMVTMVRNPSLHKYSLQAFHPVIWNEIAIGIPIAICTAYNADFDGDTVYVQFHTDENKCRELQEITPDKLWFYEKEYSPQLMPKGVVHYGLYAATKFTEPSGGVKGFMTYKELEDAVNLNKVGMTERVNLNDKSTTYAREKLKKGINLDIDVICPNKPLDKKSLAKVVSAMGYHDKRLEEYKFLQDFSTEMGTLIGYGEMPFESLYKGDDKVVKEILASNEPDGVKEAKIKEYYDEEIKKEINNLPTSNIKDIEASTSKFTTGHLQEIYSPVISSDDGGLVVNDSTLLSGWDERSYNNKALSMRKEFTFKQDMTPASGYNTRQLANLELALIYKDEIGSPDKVGIILEGKDALGRTDLNGDIIKSVIPGRVRVKSCINNPTNTVYKDEIAAREYDPEPGAIDGRKFFVRDGSAIGISFATAITECVTQSGLAFKHGGALNWTETYICKALEPGEVKSVTDRFVEVHGDHKYKYLITSMSIVYDNIKIGSIVTKDQPILRLNKDVKADLNLATFNTLTKTKVAGDDLGVYLPESESVYPLTDGTIGINEAGTHLVIDNYTYKIDDNDIYYYPIGYKLSKSFIRLSSGIPDMNALYEKSGKDAVACYYIFYYHLKTLDMFSRFNSEVFETLFKCIYENKFSVTTGISNKDSFVDRLYYGDTVSNFKDEIAKSEIDSTKWGEQEVNIKLSNGIILPMILGNQYNNGANKEEQ